MGEILVYIAAAITAAWGIAHLWATRGVVAGFGAISDDNRRIITMEWIVEGVAFLAIAAFVSVAAAVAHDAAVTIGVYAVAVATLIALALVSAFTGARIAFLPFRLCPFVLCTAAALIACGAWL